MKAVCEALFEMVEFGDSIQIAFNLFLEFRLIQQIGQFFNGGMDGFLKSRR